MISDECKIVSYLESGKNVEVDPYEEPVDALKTEGYSLKNTSNEQEKKHE